MYILKGVYCISLWSIVYVCVFIIGILVLFIFNYSFDKNYVILLSLSKHSLIKSYNLWTQLTQYSEVEDLKLIHT